MPMENEKLLHIITNQTKEALVNLSIVTPDIFSSIFSKFATQENLEIADDMSRDILKQECSALIELQVTTSQNVNSLSQTATKALDAIKNKDEAQLSEAFNETQALRQEIKKLKKSVYRDELTQTYNRKWLNDTYLKNGTDTFTNAGTMGMIDLNYFKIINDTYGHIVGDKVLILIANTLKKSGYSVVRYGGDEFIVIFPKKIDQNRAIQILNDIRDDIVSKKLRADNTKFIASFSIGVCNYFEDDNLPQTIEKADKNMYEDKLNIKQKITGITV